jgi:hypothetical protein
MLCECQITISYSRSLSKVFCCSFLVMTRKVEIPKSCIPLLDDGLMTNTFDDYLCDGVDVVIFSLVHVV